MKPILEAAIAVVRAHRALRRAAADSVPPKQRQKYYKALRDALERLDEAVAAFKPPAKPSAPPSAPFDWNGFLGTAVRGLEVVRDIRNGKATPREVANWIDAEVIDFSTPKGAKR